MLFTFGVDLGKASTYWDSNEFRANGQKT